MDVLYDRLVEIQSATGGKKDEPAGEEKKDPSKMTEQELFIEETRQIKDRLAKVREVLLHIRPFIFTRILVHRISKHVMACPLERNKFRFHRKSVKRSKVLSSTSKKWTLSLRRKKRSSRKKCASHCYFLSFFFSPSSFPSLHHFFPFTVHYLSSFF